MGDAELAQAVVEWEPLSQPRCAQLDSANPLGPDFKTIEISRDLSWQIALVAKGKDLSGHLSTPPRPKVRPGELIPPLPVFTATKDAGTVKFAFEGGHWSNYRGTQDDAVSVDLTARRVSIEYARGAPKDTICRVWCINGPADVGFYVRGTSRDRTASFTRERDDERPLHKDLRASYTDLDYLYVPSASLAATKPILAAAPAAVAPGGVRPTVLEFVLSDPSVSPEWSGIDTYLTATGFAVGRRIIPIGFSLYDEGVHPRSHHLRNAWSVDLQGDLDRPSMLPAPLGAIPPTLDRERHLDAIIGGFLTSNVLDALTDAMWMVWFAESVPMEAALPNLASALECIMNAWFRSVQSKSKAKYLDDKAWSDLSRDAYRALASALKDQANASRILSRVKNANNFGVNERFERFFEELDLPVGDVETDAIRARNKAAHGGTYDASATAALILRIRAYRTLVHRVILKIIGWTGQYNDYSSYGFAARDLHDPLGGPEGDRRPVGAKPA